MIESFPTEVPDFVDLSESLTPAEAARATLDRDPLETGPTLRYRSTGRLLMIGTQGSAAAVVDRLPRILQVHVAVAGTCGPALSGKLDALGIPVLDGLSEFELSGWLGAFRSMAVKNGTKLSLERAFGLAEAGFDLVLDLLECRAASEPVPPVGYFSARDADPRRLDEVLAQLPQCVGEFDKPKYLRLQPELCAHKTAGIETCRLCIDVCGTRAILPHDAAIAFNPYLCQGCGDCATACPSGAVVFDFPPPQRTLLRIDRMFDAYFERGGKVPVLLLHDAAEGRHWLNRHGDSLPINVLPYELDGLAVAGLDIWLMALALGATQVLLLDCGGIGKKTRALLETQVECGRSILEGCGFGPQCLRIVSADEVLKMPLPIHRLGHAEPLAAWPEQGNKRTLIRTAVRHLGKHSRTSGFARLPEGAQFGALHVDSAACTLCFKCVPVCPVAALLDPAQGRQLAFVEADCTQCGACVQTCPETAISLEPRYAYDHERAALTRVLVEKAVRQVDQGLRVK